MSRRRAHGGLLTGVSVAAVMVAVANSTAIAAGTNLAGVSAVENFSTAGTHPDPHAPYTNAGGANAPATLTLNTTTAAVIVTEAPFAIQQTTQAISLIKAGTGEISLDGANTFSGGTTLSGGTLVVDNDGGVGTGTLTFNGGVLQLKPGASLTFTNATSISAGGGTFDANGQTLAWQGAIIGVGGLNILDSSGGGKVILDPSAPGINTYTGATVIGDGVHAVIAEGGIDNAFSVASATTVSAKATLDLGGFGQVVSSLAGSGTVTNSGGASSVLVNLGASSTSFAGTIVDGAGKIGLMENGVGGHVLTLSNSGGNTYSGVTTVETGTLKGGAANAFSANSATTVNGGATLDLGGFAQTVSALAGSGTVTNSGGSAILTIRGSSTTIFSGTIVDGAVGTIGVTENSPGSALTLSHSGGNTYSGATLVEAGMLTGGATNAFSANSATTVVGVLDMGGFLQTINQNVTLAGGAIQNGTLSSTATFGLQAGLVTASLTGSGSVAKTTSGTAKLFAVNSYKGGTTVSAGTLDIIGAGTLGDTGNAVAVSGVLDLGGTVQTQNGGVTLTGGTIQNGTLASSGLFALHSGTVSAMLAGAGSVTASVGMVTLSGINSYGGGTTVSGGTLDIVGMGTLGAASNALAVADGVLDLGGTTQTQNGGVTLTGGGTIQNGMLSSSGLFALHSGTVSAMLTGTGSVTTSSDIVTLSGANSYGGGTSVEGGTLDIVGAGTLGKTSNALTVAGGVLDLGTTTQTQNGGVTLSGGGTIQNGTLSSSGTFALQSGTVSAILTGTGSVVKTTSGAVTLSGANTYSGATTVSAGTLMGGAANAFGLNSVTTVNGVLDLGGFNQTVSSLAGVGKVTNSGTAAILTNQGLSSTFAGTIVDDGTVGLTENASGNVLTLSNSGGNTYSGPTKVEAGTLRGGAANAFSPISATTVSAGATLDLGGFMQTVSSLSGTGVVTNSGASAILTNQGASSIFAGTIVDGGAGTTGLTENSPGNTLTLSGASTYTGPTLVEAGTLMGGANNAFSANSPTTVNAGAILDLGGTALTQTVNNLTLSGTLQNGTLSSAGAITIPFSASATIDADIAGTATLTNNGTLAVTPSTTSYPGTLTVANFANKGTLDISNATGTGLVTINGGYQAGANAGLTVGLVTPGAIASVNELVVNNGAKTTSGTTLVTLKDGTAGLFTNSPAVITLGSNTGGANFTLSSASAIIPNFPGGGLSLFSYALVPNAADTTWNLLTKLNTGAVAPVGGAIGSAIGLSTYGFFQGFTAFIGSPQNPAPNTVDEGVWNRDAAGVNSERSVAVSQNTPVSLDTVSHFQGLQVGSDIGIFNINNTGWNVHGGLTGGDYQTSSSELDGQASGLYTTTNFNVPFLGVYSAVSGHNFTADIAYRHDFWQGSVTSTGAGLTGATLDGNGDNVTVNTNYKVALGNGFAITPSAGFSYSRATFSTLSPFAGTSAQTTLKFAPITSELGRLSVSVSDTFAAGDWALSPFATAQIWHEFADPISGVVSSTLGQTSATVPFTDSRVGTFGQFGVGIAGQPLKLPNITVNLRADYRTGESIEGGTFTAAIRYQF